MKAHDVCPYLKPGTIVVSERSVILVVDNGAGETTFVNPHNGKEGHYTKWWTNSCEVELFIDLEDWLCAHFDRKTEERKKS